MAKWLEKVAGFTRSENEFGGIWSIIMYDRYLYAVTHEEAERIVRER